MRAVRWILARSTALVAAAKLIGMPAIIIGAMAQPIHSKTMAGIPTAALTVVEAIPAEAVMAAAAIDLSAPAW
jgi:hypothetical protein